MSEKRRRIEAKNRPLLGESGRFWIHYVNGENFRYLVLLGFDGHLRMSPAMRMEASNDRFRYGVTQRPSSPTVRDYVPPHCR